MNILFIGNFQTGPGGEAADETHLTRELEEMGHTVTRIGRDIWREYVIEGLPEGKYSVPPELTKFDIAIVGKWHHFYDGSFIKAIKKQYYCPVFYWVWDYMVDGAAPEWHLAMAKEADLYLSGELGEAFYYKNLGINFYYFQFDSCDGQYPPMHTPEREYDVVFLGSCTKQNGRFDILKEINEQVKIKVFAYDYEQWQKEGFDASPAVYGFEFNKIVAKSKIILGTSACVNCFGYWSNRVGKVLHAGGFLLQWYTPGMENFLADSCDYFSSANEAVEKIYYYLTHTEKIEEFCERNATLNKDRWTSAYKVRQLTVLMDRFIKTGGKQWMLP